MAKGNLISLPLMPSSKLNQLILWPIMTMRVWLEHFLVWYT